jgi:hypothetical protein
MSKEEKKEIKDNELSQTVIYDDDIEFYKLTRIFLQIPFEYSSMGGAVGKHYQASKDFLKWNGFQPKKWMQVILHMGIVWANEANSA